MPQLLKYPFPKFYLSTSTQKKLFFFKQKELWKKMPELKAMANWLLYPYLLAMGKGLLPQLRTGNSFHILYQITGDSLLINALNCSITVHHGSPRCNLYIITKTSWVTLNPLTMKAQVVNPPELPLHHIAHHINTWMEPILTCEGMYWVTAQLSSNTSLANTINNQINAIGWR